MGQCASRPQPGPPPARREPSLSPVRAQQSPTSRPSDVEALLAHALRSLTSFKSTHKQDTPTSKCARQEALETTTSGIHTALPLLNPDRFAGAGKQAVLVIVQQHQDSPGASGATSSKLRLALAWASHGCLQALKANSLEEYSQFLQVLMAGDSGIASRLYELCKMSLEHPHLSSAMLETVVACGPTAANPNCANRGVHVLAIRPCLWAPGNLRQPALLVEHLPVQQQGNTAHNEGAVEMHSDDEEPSPDPLAPDVAPPPGLVPKLTSRLAGLLAVVESSPIMMTVCTVDGKVVYQNSCSACYAGRWAVSDGGDFLDELFKLQPGLHENAKEAWIQGDPWNKVIEVPAKLNNKPTSQVEASVGDMLAFLEPLPRTASKTLETPALGVSATRRRSVMFAKARPRKSASTPDLLTSRASNEMSTYMSQGHGHRLQPYWASEDNDAEHEFGLLDTNARAVSNDGLGIDEDDDMLAAPDFAIRTTFCDVDLGAGNIGSRLRPTMSGRARGSAMSSTFEGFTSSQSSGVRSRVMSLLDAAVISPGIHGSRSATLLTIEYLPPAPGCAVEKADAGSPGANAAATAPTTLNTGSAAEGEVPLVDIVAQGDGSPEVPQGKPAVCWHDVHIIPFLDPETSQKMVLVTQTDVTHRSKLEHSFMQLLEMQLYMLENIFPRHILERLARLAATHESSVTMPALMKELNQEASHHECVTIMFTDIVGFTSMAKEVEPAQVMHFLNRLFTVFDELALHHKVYKVETAGDCYIVCAGLLDQDADGFRTLASDDSKSSARTTGARRVLNFAVDMLRAARAITMPNNGQPVQQRVGVHSGPIVSGLIGTLQPKFNLFGDTMNTASRMESTSLVGRIQVSEATYELLKDPGPHWEPSGGVEVKGKGVMNTYLLAAQATDVDTAMLFNTLDLGSGAETPDRPTFMDHEAMYPTAKDTGSAKSLCKNVLGPWLGSLARQECAEGLPSLTETGPGSWDTMFTVPAQRRERALMSSMGAVQHQLSQGSASGLPPLTTSVLGSPYPPNVWTGASSDYRGMPGISKRTSIDFRRAQGTISHRASVDKVLHHIFGDDRQWKATLGRTKLSGGDPATTSGWDSTPEGSQNGQRSGLA